MFQLAAIKVSTGSDVVATISVVILTFAQLGPKLNTKIGLNHPPPETFRPLQGKVGRLKFGM